MDKDLRTLFVFALRYSLPRHTYALSIVAPQVLNNIQYFEDWEIEGMISDCDIYYPSADFGGASCDQPAVDKLKAQLQTELDRRNKNE
jgi:hypothetical protein